MSTFSTQQFTTVRGVSEKRRLPRLGKIRLGCKLSKGTTEYPAELPFFLLPDDVACIYGGEVTVERAKELGCTRSDVLDFIAKNTHRLAESMEVMFPVDDVGVIFPQAYKMYGASKGIKCMGNGEKAMKCDTKTGELVETECPCHHLKTEKNSKGECALRGSLLILVPKVSLGGVYQIDVGSYNSIVDINSGIDYVKALIGRFAMVPLTLRRIPMETHHNEKKQIHFILQLIFNGGVDQLNELRQDTQRVISHTEYILPSPEDASPVLPVEPERPKAIESTGNSGEPLDEDQGNTDRSSELFLDFEARFRFAKSIEELEKIAEEITEKTKARMTKGDVTDLTTVYNEVEKKLKGGS